MSSLAEGCAAAAAGIGVVTGAGTLGIVRALSRDLIRVIPGTGPEGDAGAPPAPACPSRHGMTPTSREIPGGE